MKKRIVFAVVFIMLFDAMLAIHASSFHANFTNALAVNTLRLDKIEPHAWSIEEHMGRNALKITIKSGDKRARNTERSEMQDPLKLPIGEEVWYRIDLNIPNNFPKVNNRLAIWQIKQSGSKNPLLSMYYVAGKLKIKQSFDNDQINYYQPNSNSKPKSKYTGKWLSIIIHTKASLNNDGFVNVYIDNDKIIEYTGQTAHHSNLEQKTYFKFGLYRDIIDMPMHIFYQQYIRGNTLGDVTSDENNRGFNKTLWKVKRKKI